MDGGRGARSKDLGGRQDSTKQVLYFGGGPTAASGAAPETCAVVAGFDK